ncbi:MAG: hypothetical protein QXP01_09475 [Candidatus Hadarchaeum sp.]
MAEIPFATVRVDDARIVKLMLEGATLCLWIRGWQGDKVLIEFTDVIGIEGFEITDVDLGRVHESTTDPLIEKSCSFAGELRDGFNCYSFLSAWNDQPLLKVVAKSWKIRDALTQP